jgi:hypothetical protein
MQDLRDQLTEALDEAEWSWLVPHVHRDALVVVGADLDLVEAGMAIANDQVQMVTRWINEQIIYKPTADQLNDWERDRSQRFTTLIVQPYVLIKEPTP